jgi:hypothetical protein
MGGNLQRPDAEGKAKRKRGSRPGGGIESGVDLPAGCGPRGLARGPDRETITDW